MYISDKNLQVRNICKCEKVKIIDDYKEFFEKAKTPLKGYRHELFVKNLQKFYEKKGWLWVISIEKNNYCHVATNNYCDDEYIYSQISNFVPLNK